MDSPVRPFRMPRFSVSPTGNTADENRPAFFDGSGSDATDAPSIFPRQLVSSPSRFQDRNVLLLLGNKVPSSVPGRRSSIACSKDRKALAPLIIFEDEIAEDALHVSNSPKTRKLPRSKSMRPLGNSNRTVLDQTKTCAKSLRRL